MQSGKKPFLLMSESPGVLVQVLNAIHSLGASNCIVVLPKGIRQIRLTNMTSRRIYADFHGKDDDYLIAEINRLATDMPDLTVIPCDCAGERLVDRIGPRLNAARIPAPDAAMLDCFDDKWQFYRFCRQHRLDVPFTRLVASKHDLDFSKAAGEFGLPFILKPVNQAGSAGVHVISSEAEFRRKIMDDEQYQFSPLLIQQYVRGTDICLDLLSIHGRITAIAVRQRDFPQHFGAPINFISHPGFESAAHAICEISGYHGVMDIDARIEEETGRVFLLESNPRFWGTLSASVWCGLNFVEACLEPPPPPGQMRRLHAGRASMHYHPLIRPALWGHALFSLQAHRRRMLRAMIGDLWTFLVQFRSLRNKVRVYLGAHFNFSRSKPGRKHSAFRTGISARRSKL